MLNDKEFVLAMQQRTESVWVEKQTESAEERSCRPAAHARGRG